MVRSSSSRRVARRGHLRWWWSAAAVSVIAAVMAYAAVAARTPDHEPAGPPAAPSPATSTPGTRAPIPVQPDLPGLDESQFGDGPSSVPPTEPPATDVGTPSGAVSPPSP